MTRQRLAEIVANAGDPSQTSAEDFGPESIGNGGSWGRLEREVERGAVEMPEPTSIDPASLFEAPDGKIAEAIETKIDGMRLVGTRSRRGIRLVADSFASAGEVTGSARDFFAKVPARGGPRMEAVEISLLERLSEAPRPRTQVGQAQNLGTEVDSERGWSGWISKDGLLEMRRTPPWSRSEFA
jgi:hypothetical protein